MFKNVLEIAEEFEETQKLGVLCGQIATKMDNVSMLTNAQPIHSLHNTLYLRGCERVTIGRNSEPREPTAHRGIMGHSREHGSYTVGHHI